MAAKPKKGKKPQKTKAKMGMAASMSAAAHRLGFSPSSLKSAKEAGCPAFRANSAVNLDELVEWLAKNPDVISEERLDKKVEETLRIRVDRMSREFKLSVLKGHYLLASNVTLAVGRAASEIRSQIVGTQPSLAERIAGEVGGEPGRIQKIIAERDREIMGNVNKAWSPTQ